MQIHDKNQLRQEELIHLIALSMLPSIGAASLKELLRKFGGAKNAYEMAIKRRPLQTELFSNQKNMTPEKLLALASKELEFTNDLGIKITTLNDEDYPFRLAQCPDAPVVLYSMGDFPVKARHHLGIVGTRKATDRGIRLCLEFIHDLKGLDLCVISGMALGIDTVAHIGALENEMPTIAVLGHGLNRIYPASNAGLSRDILKSGCLLTEFSRLDGYSRGNFPSRNRIIAGLSDAVLVVESAKKGGSLITAELANSYNREVLAFPGRPGDELSKGCNDLIKRNGAALIESAEDLLNWMNWSLNKVPKPVQSSIFHDLNTQEEKIVDLLRLKGEVHWEQLINLMSLSFSDLSSILLDLELREIIESRPGRIYRLRD